VGTDNGASMRPRGNTRHLKQEALRQAKEKRGGGMYVPLPFDVLRSPALPALSAHAVKLLLDLLAQYNLRNNGDLTAAWTVMSKRGWKSRDTLFKAVTELESHGWIIKTRQGGRKRCNLYAVTFFAIDECGGKLDMAATTTPPGTWHQKGKYLPAIPGLINRKFTDTQAGSPTTTYDTDTVRATMRPVESDTPVVCVLPGLMKSVTRQP
jgi:hypothetical protein